MITREELLNSTEYHLETLKINLFREIEFLLETDLTLRQAKILARLGYLLYKDSDIPVSDLIEYYLAFGKVLIFEPIYTEKSE